MTWSIAGEGPAAHRLAEALGAATIVPVPEWRPSGGPVAVVGTDSDLASIGASLADGGERGPVGFLPTGRSDLLRMFGLDPANAIDRLGSGTEYSVDLGRCSVDGRASPFVGHAHARGRRSADLTISGDGRESSMRGWWVVASNAQHLDGATLAPRAAVMDGLLDLQVFSGPRGRTRQAVRRGLHDRTTGVWRRTRSTAQISCPSRWQVTVDGVVVGRGAFSVEVEPGAFDLLI